MKVFDPGHLCFESAGWSSLDGTRFHGPPALFHKKLAERRHQRRRSKAGHLSHVLAAIAEELLHLLLECASGAASYSQLARELGIDRRTAKALIQALHARVRKSALVKAAQADVVQRSSNGRGMVQIERTHA